jgi:hypothetical protein
MATHRDNKYSVNARLSELASRVTALEAENKELRVHLAGQLETKINDAKHLIQASIRVPLDGKDGRDGRDSTVPGPRGDITVYGPEELQATVIELRRKLKEHHAAVLARLIEGIEANRRGSSSPSARILASHLETIKRDIEKL